VETVNYKEGSGLKQATHKGGEGEKAGKRLKGERRITHARPLFVVARPRGEGQEGESGQLSEKRNS